MWLSRWIVVVKINGALIKSETHITTFDYTLLTAIGGAQNLMKVKDQKKEKLDNGSKVEREYPFEKNIFRFTR